MLAAVLIAGCTSQSGYFPTQDASTVGIPAATNGQALLEVTDLAALGNDTVRLVDARPTGVSGAGMLTAYALRTVQTGGGGIGAIAGDTFGDGFSFSAHAVPVQGFVFSSTDGPVEVVMRVQSGTKETVSYDGVDLVYTINGGQQETQHFPAAGIACFASPAPSGC